MRLNQFSDYALRVLMYCALDENGSATISDVSTTFRISRNHLVKVVHQLGKLGFLQTRRGIGGGFRLARRPEEIRIGQLIRLLESSLLVECFDPETNQCVLIGACRLKQVLAEAQHAFYAALDRHTLADLASAKAPMRLALGL